MNIKEKLGRRVKVLRITRGWSQMELGFRADIGHNYISDLERGQRNVTLIIIERIAKALEIEVWQLLEFK
jgi:Predicted transcriptional regulator